MVAALIYSIIPPLILGRMKLLLAAELHDKPLQTDANINQGDWLTQPRYLLIGNPRIC